MARLRRSPRVHASEQESIYRIATDGGVTALQPAPGQQLGRLYAAALECESFTVVRQHRLAVDGEPTDCKLLLLGDEEARLRGSALNTRVSSVLEATFYGHALVVCVHAPDEDGDDDTLADVGVAYSAMGRGLTPPWSEQDIAAYRSEPLEGRVLELLELTTLDEESCW